MMGPLVACVLVLASGACAQFVRNMDSPAYGVIPLTEAAAFAGAGLNKVEPAGLSAVSNWRSLNAHPNFVRVAPAHFAGINVEDDALAGVPIPPGRLVTLRPTEDLSNIAAAAAFRSSGLDAPIIVHPAARHHPVLSRAHYKAAGKILVRGADGEAYLIAASPSALAKAAYPGAAVALIDGDLVNVAGSPGSSALEESLAGVRAAAAARYQQQVKEPAVAYKLVFPQDHFGAAASTRGYAAAPINVDNTVIPAMW